MGWPAALIVPLGTGALESRKREPTCEPAGIGVSALRPGKITSGFVPVSAVEPPLEARNAYGTASAVAPTPSSWLMYVTCCGERFLNVWPAIVTLEVRLPCTSLVKKPDSLRRRCSKAKKKNVRPLSNGPPSVNPYCARVNGGSSIGAKALRAWKLRCRRNPNKLPCSSFVPDFVTTFTTPPADRTTSAANELVTT